MRWHKLAIVLVTGALLVAYIAVRPALATRWPYLHLAEFPIAVLVLGTVLWAALRVPRAERPPPAPAWRRHEQKVRSLPDPEAARLQSALGAWIAEGGSVEAAADILARAVGNDTTERDALRERFAQEMRQLKPSRKKRAAFLKTRLSNAPKTRAPGA